MIKNSIVEESTPVFGDAPEAEAPQENKVLSWDEEKTLLVFEDEEAAVSARLLNSQTGEVFELNEFPYLVGRNKTADLQIKHRSVSREHARISLQSGATGFIVEDAGSSNGIRVNGIKTTKVMLGDNDRIKFGDVEFLFEVDAGDEAVVQTAVVASNAAAPISSTAVESQAVPDDAAPKPSGLASGMSWATLKQRVVSKLPAKRASQEAGDGDLTDGESEKKSRYPLIAAAAAVVLGLAYVLSPARRVEIIDVPAVANAPAAGEVESTPADTPTDSAASVEDAQEQVAAENAPESSAPEQVAGEVSTTDVESPENESLASGDTPGSDAPGSDTPASDAQVDAATDANVVTTDSLLADAERAEKAAGAMVTDLTDARDVAVAKTDTDSAQAVANVAPPAEAPKPVIRRSPQWSRGYIRNSLEMYTNGDVDNAVRRLRILSRSGRHQPQFRQQAGDLADGIDAMYQKYQNGRAQFDSGRHDEAFQVWRSFLVDESNLLPGEESVFSRSIKSEVVNLYTQQGNTASAEGRRHEAYLAWQKASTIAPGGEAAAALADLEKRAKQRFIDGYMQESVSLQTATSMWRDVLEMVPPANEYHIKAKAKLRLYKNYGS